MRDGSRAISTAAEPRETRWGAIEPNIADEHHLHDLEPVGLAGDCGPNSLGDDPAGGDDAAGEQDDQSELDQQSVHEETDQIAAPHAGKSSARDAWPRAAQTARRSRTQREDL